MSALPKCPAIRRAAPFAPALLPPLALLFAAGFSTPLAAQTVSLDCTTSGSTQSCTASGGPYTQPILQHQNTENASLDSAASLDLTANSSTTGFYGINVYTLTSASGSGASAATAGAASVVNLGTISFTSVDGLGRAIYGILNQSVGGAGIDGSGSGGAGGNGGAAQAASVSNQASITLSNGGATTSAPDGGAVIESDSIGGGGGAADGGDTGGSSKAAGGNGGAAGAASIANSGSIAAGTPSAPLAGSGGFVGLLAQSLGGAGGSGGDGTSAPAGNGGAANTATIQTSLPVSLAWQWNGGASNTMGVFGVLAASIGGAGGNSDRSQTNGGLGGAGGAATVTLSNDVSVSASGTAPGAAPDLNVPSIAAYTAGGITGLAGAAVAAVSTGGAGGVGYDTATGGQGGNAGVVNLDVSSAAISAAGSAMAGAVALSQGGAGGNGLDQQDHNNAGSGGGGGNAGIDLTTSSGNALAIATSGTGGPAVVVTSAGGVGGIGATITGVDAGSAGAGGNGGNGGAVSVQTSTGGGSIAVSTAAADAPGLVVSSIGANGGLGGTLSAINFEDGDTHGNGGTGGASGSVTVSLDNGTSVRTSGDNSSAVLARSIGGTGGDGGTLSIDFGVDYQGYNGGNGGSTGQIEVNLAAGVSLATQGANANGLVVLSASGAGGAAGAVTEPFGDPGPGSAGNGGTTGTIDVTSAASIATQGENARGILVQALSGAGGTGAYTAGAFYSHGGTGGSSGALGAVTLDNSGTISTAGSNAEAIVGQTIAGGGGAAANLSGGFIDIGGSSGPAGNGGSLTLTDSGTLSTQGSGALAILAQSIGGGGGDGGGASGLVSVGGSGGGGGNGGLVQVNLYDSITTLGQLAPALLAQSVGGGGGNGGNAAAASAVLAIGVGGSGGSGGSGGASGVYALNNRILTEGANSAGILAQSIGGGGGVGGSSDVFSAGVVGSLSFSVGGSGGSGGAGGMTTVTAQNAAIATGQAASLTTGTATPTNTSPTSAYGILAQSIGGGGGLGGSALAQAFAVGVPVTESGTSLAVAVSFAMGGSGGNGGNGGTVGVNLTDGTAIQTSGQGSDAVLAQSIGGGGGAGGDGSALASTFEYGRAVSAASSATEPKMALSLTIAIGIGGNGAIAGNGGAASVAIGGTTDGTADPAGSAPVSITTFGDYADGALVQSIGGGGGNGAIGATSTAQFGDTGSLNVKIGVGGTGGAGGNGGNTNLTLFAGNSVTTFGSGAIGLMAQSIGGGGGASQGVTVDLGGAFTASGNNSPVSIIPNATVQISVGLNGAGGGNGGVIGVTSLGTIRTTGGGSTALLAQSIGGGGGLGGGSGGDASADNPVLSSSLTGLREYISNIGEKNLNFGGTFSLAVGGAGGAAGNGDQVNVLAGGSIATTGDWAQGIVAQSIGGGGGMAGSAMASGSGEAPRLSLNVGATISQGAGAGGDGGTVNLGLQNLSLSTAGYWAYGALAQSIGGGGGIGADGSVAAEGGISVGANFSGGGGAGGNGEAVTLTSPAASLIETTGEAAHAVVLQSIGGGGGIGGQGMSLSGGVSGFSASTTLTAGGRGGASGSGGAVSADQVVLQLATSGANAFGLLAQSIGGGGGIAGAAASDGITAVSLGGQSSSASNGGAVNLSLAAGSAIVTTGSGADGIVAQSIGGGGGIANFPNGAPSLSFSPPSSGLVTNGSGGDVTVNADAEINVSGAGAIGILAQSIGGGGGMMAEGSTVYLGSTGASGSAGTAGAVTITQAGTINASGAGSIGILAQSAAAPGAADTGYIGVTINGTVLGGSGSGAGVVEIASSGVPGRLQVNAGGLLGAASGTAVIFQGTNFLGIENYGEIDGSLLNPQTGSGIDINNFGTLKAGSAVDGVVTNYGTLIPALGASGGQTTMLELIQQPGAVIAPGVDFTNRSAGMVVVTGGAQLAGTILPIPVNVLPNIAVPVLTVAPGSYGSIAGGTDALYTYTVTQNGNVYSVAATNADFDAVSQGLNASESAVAGHFQAIWDAGGNAAFAPYFAALGQAANAGGGAYAHALSTLAPGATLGIGAHVAPGLENFANSLLSCPMFESSGADLREGACSWVRANGRITNQVANGGAPGFQIRSSGVQIGGQQQFAPHWFLGGSFAYGQDWLSSSDGASSGSGQNVEAGFSLKHEVGDWLFALAGFAGHQDFRTARLIALPGTLAVADAKPLTNGGGLRLRIADTFGAARFYARPFLDLDAVYASAPGYTETGAGALSLQVSGHRQLLGVASPMLEIGGRTDLQDGATLRSYLQLGVSFLSQGGWQSSARFFGAPDGVSGFASTMPMDRVQGRIGAGLQVLTRGHFDLRLQYDGTVSDHLTSHGGTLIAAYRF